MRGFAMKRSSLKWKAKHIVFFLAFMLSAYAHGRYIEWAPQEWNCFEVVPGYIPHIVCTLYDFKAIDFAIDKYGENGWEVVQHATRSMIFLTTADEGDVIADGSIPRNYTIEGLGENFFFAFTWDGNSSGANGYSGWMQLTTKNGELSIANSFLNTVRGQSMVVGAIPEPTTTMLLLLGLAPLALRRLAPSAAIV